MKKIFTLLFAAFMATTTVWAQFNPVATPLTLEAKEASTQILIENNSSAAFEYRVNGAGEWQTIASQAQQKVALAAMGDYVEIKGHAATTCRNGLNSHIGLETGSAYIYGNIMSLVEGAVPFDQNTVLEGDSTFFRLFRGDTLLTNHPTKAFVLPATTLRPSCYNNMLRGTGLTQAPALPATKLQDNCYKSIFYDCKSLTQAPELPAEAMAESCYAYMFGGCTALTQAPALPALTLARSCYDDMFRNCTALTKAPELPATEMQPYCYDNMFRGAGLTQAPELPATIMAQDCYRSLFSECPNLTQAPALPATTLAPYCYSYMFYRAPALTEAPALPATKLVDECYFHMFDSCVALTQAPKLPATSFGIFSYGYMFRNCISLTQAPELASTTVYRNCYGHMFEGCTALTKAPELPATKMEQYCYVSMFESCTALTESPVLPAKSLYYHCYDRMFAGCANLNKVTCLATTYDAEYTSGWLENVAATGTFVKAPDFDGWVLNSADGIPAGWEVMNYSATGIETPSLQGRSGEASKLLRNGQLLIEKNGKTYNAQGIEVK
ncbi:MAG: leucine-rich repeat protein [Paludibacteraceae bacterium]|nr:leucine-rich repeat protein [Paludibacteraceae bacterium]